MPVKTLGFVRLIGIAPPGTRGRPVQGDEALHENQSKKGRNCSDVALGGGLGGMGTVDGILPLITTGGMEGNAGGAVDVDDVVAVEAVVVGEVVAVSGAGPVQPRRSAVRANDRKSMRVVDMIDSFTLGVSEESKSLPHPICVHLRKGFIRR